MACTSLTETPGLFATPAQLIVVVDDPQAEWDEEKEPDGFTLTGTVREVEKPAANGNVAGADMYNGLFPLAPWHCLRAKATAALAYMWLKGWRIGELLGSANFGGLRFRRLPGPFATAMEQDDDDDFEIVEEASGSAGGSKRKREADDAALEPSKRPATRKDEGSAIMLD